ncbi:FkbM family methyltransferase [Geodermatophilus sp. Leaf369]|uniref:FkbM family methyltransferase n=1 Tax=Geodermatophilus sp. Leaf369 TaxID=1736354 RepID=UPI00138F21AF|nr:FkbM family methyltransferase [Geodermatophilus sp. Leaf369]
MPAGRYVEVGANHPTTSSITRAFYDRGWRGIEIEPVTAFVEAYRSERPGDTVVQAAITADDVDSVVVHVVAGTGLSTLDDSIIERHRADGWEANDEIVPARTLDDVLDEHLTVQDPIHFMVVDVEGSEATVLESVDLDRWRPWVLVVEATAPNSTTQTHAEWESIVVGAGYEFCLFDGLSRFYVAAEHAAEMRPHLVSPANPLDVFVTHDAVVVEARLRDQEARITRLERERREALEDLIRWRGTVLSRWAAAASGGTSTSGAPTHEVVRLREELEAIRETVSWRVTAPLRTVQKRRLEGRR